MGSVVLLDLMGGVALLLWGLHMVHSGILRAFDANNLGTELWNSLQNQTRDDIITWPKYSVPTVVNGKVYMGSFSNALYVFGMLSPDFMVSAAPANVAVTQSGTNGYDVTVGVQAGFNSPVT